jgi:hypothetical protein
MRPPSIIATITGHLPQFLVTGTVKPCKVMAYLQYVFAMHLSHDESVSFASAKTSRPARYIFAKPRRGKNDEKEQKGCEFFKRSQGYIGRPSRRGTVAEVMSVIRSSASCPKRRREG